MAFSINKLYRDNLVPQQIAMGRKVKYTQKTWKELIDALYLKADEELQELQHLFESSREYTQEQLVDLQKKILSEAKDIQEVIDVLLQLGKCEIKMTQIQDAVDAVCDKFSITKEMVAAAQEIDRENRWSFTKWYFVHYQDIPQDTEENKKRHEYFSKKYKQIQSF